MGRLSLLLTLLLSGCFVDMSGAYDLAEARAAFDAVPTVSLGEYEQGISRQEIRQAPASIARPSIQDVPDVSLPDAGRTLALGQGPERARLEIGQDCQDLPAVSGMDVLIVAEFAEDLPASDTIFAARRYQAVLAQCVEQAGGRAKFQTRIAVPGLSSASEIVIYTS